MKAYTDIEQSKKLTEILPIESADMTYTPIMDIDSMSNSGFLDIPECYSFNEFKNSSIKPLPCWSLAALLSVLPYPSLHKTFMGWRCDSYNKEGTTCKLGETSDNQVDACYEMILKLHELKML